MPYKRTHRLGLIPLAMMIAACTSTTVNVPADTPVAQTAADVTVATNYDASLAWAAADPVPVGLFILDATTATAPEAVPGTAAASAAAGAANQNFSPSGCVSASASTNVATFNLNNCTGPAGLTSASGTVTATFTPSLEGLHIQLAGNNISVNGAKINIASQGLLTIANDMVTKTFQAMSSGTGTGPFGNSVARAGSYSLTWQSGSACGTINAAFADAVGDAGAFGDGGTLADSGVFADSDVFADASTADSGVFADAASVSTTTISSYLRCRGQCPQSGTTTRTFNDGSMTITYNGSSNPPWTASNGESGTINLHCP